MQMALECCCSSHFIRLLPDPRNSSDLTKTTVLLSEFQHSSAAAAPFDIELKFINKKRSLYKLVYYTYVTPFIVA